MHITLYVTKISMSIMLTIFDVSKKINRVYVMLTLFDVSIKEKRVYGSL